MRDRFARLPMKMKKREYERERQDLWGKLDRGRKSTVQVFTGDKDYKELRQHHNQDFADAYDKAYRTYKVGDFEKAYELFEVA